MVSVAGRKEGRAAETDRVVVRLKERVSERLGRGDSCPRVEHEHLLEQVDRRRRGLGKLLAKRDPFALGQGLDKAESLFEGVREG